MTDINKVPDADVIAKRIFDVTTLDDITKELITQVLNSWNDEWIEYIAENKTGKSDNTEKARRRDNEKRLKDRIDKLGGESKQATFELDDPGF